MANINLQDPQLRISSFSMDYTADKSIVRTTSGRIRFYETGTARRVISVTLVALTDDEKNYLRGVLQAAYYANDSVTLTLPEEAFRYTGSVTANGKYDVVSFNVSGTPPAGQNNVEVTGNPADTAIPRGNFFQIADLGTSFTATGTNESDGSVVFTFPTTGNTFDANEDYLVEQGSNSFRINGVEFTEETTTSANDYRITDLPSVIDPTSNVTFSPVQSQNGLYVVNEYNPTTDKVIFHPQIRKTVSANSRLFFSGIRFRGFITNDISEAFLPNAHEYLSVDLIIEEDLS